MKISTNYVLPVNKYFLLKFTEYSSHYCTKKMMFNNLIFDEINNMALFLNNVDIFKKFVYKLNTCIKKFEFLVFYKC